MLIKHVDRPNGYPQLGQLCMICISHLLSSKHFSVWCHNLKIISQEHCEQHTRETWLGWLKSLPLGNLYTCYPVAQWTREEAENSLRRLLGLLLNSNFTERRNVDPGRLKLGIVCASGLLLTSFDLKDGIKVTMVVNSVHWFRKGLRLHDNPALQEALNGADTVRCVYILDPWFAGSAIVGVNRWRSVAFVFRGLWL